VNNIFKKISIFFIFFVCLYVFLQINLTLQTRAAQNAKTLITFEENIKHQEPHSSGKEMGFFETAFKFKKNEINFKDREVVGGIIPHNLLAADLIADFFHNIKDKDYDTVILIGSNRYSAGNSDIITSSYDWQTPYGILKCDEEMVGKFLKIDGVALEEHVIGKEHSITNNAPFIKKIFPNAKLAPIILKHNITEEEAGQLALKIFEAVEGKKAIVIASVDFPHYKDSEMGQKNDKEIIGAISDFSFDKIYDLDIDSPPSIYTLLKFSELAGASFWKLNNSNFAILADKEITEAASYVTGYFVEEDIPARMLFFGDLMLDRYVKNRIKEKGVEYIFEKLDKESFFSEYDLISANFEGAAADKGAYYSPNNNFDFSFNPKTVEKLKNYNFNFFNLANNHFADQGEKGILETRKNLGDAGFEFSGCKNGKMGDCSSKIVEVVDRNIAMVGLSIVGGKLDYEKVKILLEDIKKESDFIVINIHWGQEYKINSNEYQKDTAHKLADFGANLIIGHHPHVVQEIEVYKKIPIFYSLGNFVFDQYFSEETQKGLAVEMSLTDNELTFKLHPLKSKLSRVELMDGKDKDDFLKRIGGDLLEDGDGFSVEIGD